jgi:hypothetical protein
VVIIAWRKILEIPTSSTILHSLSSFQTTSCTWNYWFIFPTYWIMSRMSVTYDSYLLLFKMMDPIKISCSAPSCTSKCYLHQLPNFCHHFWYPLTELNAYALFCALEYCDKIAECQNSGMNGWSHC